MKNTTLQNRLAKRFTGSKSSKAYKIVIDLINKTNKTHMVSGNTIRPCTTSGGGKFTSNLDYTYDVKCLLDSLDVKYVAGNDSPRGGLTGNYIKITTKITY